MTTTLHPETDDALELQESAPAEPVAATRSLFRAACRGAGKVASWAGVLAVVAVVALVALWPAVQTVANEQSPVTAQTVLTGSMEPTYMPGDVVVVQHLTSPRGYEIGDALMFYPKSNDPDMTTHRIIAVTLGSGPGSVDGVVGFTTQGDANDIPDEPIVVGQAIGKVQYSVPKVGYFIQWAKSAMSDAVRWVGEAGGNAQGLTNLAVGAGIVLILTGGLSLIPWGRIFRRRA